MRQRTQRSVTALAVAIALLLATGLSVAVDRLGPPGGLGAAGAAGGPRHVLPIEPPYTFLPLPAGYDAPAVQPRVTPPAVTAGARSCPAMPPVAPTPATAARAVGATLDVYAAPGGARLRTLRNPTVEGQLLTVSVVESRGAWLRVRLPMRPNGVTGWVRVTDVAQYAAPYRIVVQLCSHRLTVFRNGVAAWRQPVAVGAPRTPTPKGDFYIDGLFSMRAGGAYGPYLLSVSGFSNVLQQFGKNGIGQIGLHGTNRPASIGTSASHGCVRLHNDALRLLVKMVVPGTPVTIVD